MEQMENQSPSNPADRPLITIDTNIVFALLNDEPDAQFARQLLAFNRANVITINITLSTAFEGRRAGDEQERHYYVTWLQEQGVDCGNIFTHALTIGFRRLSDPPHTIYFDHELELGLYERVHNILFPNIPYSWYDYRDQECTRLDIVGTRQMALAELDALSLGRYIPPTPQAPRRQPTPALDTLEQTKQEALRATLNRLIKTWMNAKNDSMGLYNHLTRAVNTTYPEQAVFVTSDHNFRKQTKLSQLRQLGFRGEILPPAEAVAFILKVTGTSLP